MRGSWSQRYQLDTSEILRVKSGGADKCNKTGHTDVDIPTSRIPSFQTISPTMTINGGATAPSAHRPFLGNVFSVRGGTISNHLANTSRPSDEPDNVQRYTNQLNELVQDLKTNLPSVDENLGALFETACESTVLAKVARDAAVKVRDEATDDQQKTDADAAVAAADAALAKAFDVNVAAAEPILQSLHVLEESDLDGTLDIDTTKLMQCYVLTHGTPQSLGEFANQGPHKAALLDNLLSDSNLLRQVVLASGAKYGRYARHRHDEVDAMLRFDGRDSPELGRICQPRT